MNFGLIKKVASSLAQTENQARIHVRMHEGNLEILTDDPTIPKYNWSHVQALKSFLHEDIPVKIIIGPYGSGKTSGMIQIILEDAISMPLCDDGIRRYKIAIIRNTAGDLETTTLNTWRYWTRGLPMPKQNKKPVFTLTYNLRDKDGEIELHVLFLALDRPQDFNKLASLELSAAFFNEIQFIPKSLVDHMQSRVNRYPAKMDFIKRFDREHPDLSKKESIEAYKDWRPFNSNIFADTNPPEEDHWIPAMLEKEPLKNIRVYHQPPALLKDEAGKWYVNAEADNLHNIGSKYYLDMIDRGEEYVRVYAQGKYGTAIDGQAVYQNYNDDLHSVETLNLMTKSTIYLGIDYGTVCPAIVLAQFIGGQLRIIKEFIGEYMTIKELYKVSVAPFLIEYCEEMTIEAIGDPADTYDGRAQLEECGIEVTPARTNNIGARISGVNNLLNELSRAKPRLIVSREHCKKLRAGFIGKYHYKRLKVIGEDRYHNVPYKNHPYSDIHDCLQYIVMTLLDEEGLKKVDDYIPVSNWDEEDRSDVTGY